MSNGLILYKSNGQINVDFNASVFQYSQLVSFQATYGQVVTISISEMVNDGNWFAVAVTTAMCIIQVNTGAFSVTARDNVTPTTYTFLVVKRQ